MPFVNVPISLAGGIDQKSDQMTVAGGKVTNLVNGVYNKLNTVQTRHGNALVTTSPAEGIANLAVYNNELVSFSTDGQTIYTLSQVKSIWNPIDQIPPPTVDTTSLFWSSDYTIDNDIALCNGYWIGTWCNSTTGGGTTGQGVFVAAWDSKTNSIAIPPTLLLTNSYNPHVVVDNAGHAAVTYGLGLNTKSSFFAQTIDCTSGFPVLSSSYLLSASNSSQTAQVYDIDSDGTQAHVAYVDDQTLTHYQVFSFNIATGVVSGSKSKVLDLTKPPAATSTANGISISAWTGSAGLRLWVATADTIGHISASVFNPNTTSPYAPLFGPTQVSSASLVSWGNHQTFNQIGIVALNDLTASLSWMNGNTGQGAFGTTVVSTNPYNLSASVITATTGAVGLVGPLRSGNDLIPIAKPFYMAPITGSAATKVYQAMVMGSGSFNASTVMLDLALDTTASFVGFVPVATSNLRESSPWRRKGHMSHTTITTNSNGYPLVVAATGQPLPQSFTAEAGGFEMQQWNWDPINRFNTAQISNLLFVCGGVPFFYDGKKTIEAGFIQAPIMTTAGSTSAGNLPAGTYSYSAVFEWYDNQGNRHQSNPATVQSVTLGSTGHVTVSVNPLSVEMRERLVVGANPYVVVAFYRSAVNSPNVLYRLPIVASIDRTNEPAGAQIVYNDTGTHLDPEIIQQESLYTIGELGSLNPPSCKYAVSHLQRLFIAGTDDPKAVWYTDQVTAGEPVYFNDNLQIEVSDGGPITGLASLNNNLIVFKADRIFAIAGQGPDPLGTTINLSDPEVIITDGGCINARSIETTPDGIVFQSNIGIQLLGTNEEVQPIGLPVADTLALYPVITSAVRHPSQNQVRFSCKATEQSKTGVWLVYDYVAKAWSIFQATDAGTGRVNVGCEDAVVLNGVYYWISSDGTLHQETSGWTDGSAFIPVTIETAWSSADDLDSFQIVRRVGVVGQCKDLCDLTVSFGNDYTSGSYNQSITFPAASYNTPGQTLNVEANPTQHRCEAMRVKLQTSAPASGSFGTGQGLTFARVVLQTKPKTGMHRVPPTSKG